MTTQRTYIEMPRFTIDTDRTWIPGAARAALGVSSGARAASLSATLDVFLAERDELYAATLAAILRRDLPAIVERAAAEAHGRIFPGDEVKA